MAVLKESRLTITPEFIMEPALGTGRNDFGLATAYEMAPDDDDWTYTTFVYSGNTTADFSSSSAFADMTFVDALGDDFGTPLGIEFLRIQVSRIPDTSPPDPAHPVEIVILGPGLPALTVDAMAPYDVTFYQPYVSGYTTALNGSTSHLAASVPVANQGILLLTITMKLRKAT